MLQRKPTWAEDLYTFIRCRKDTPYSWGDNDCCSFVCDAILAMTGTDTYEDFRGKYTDEATSEAAMLEVTGSSDKLAMVEYMTTKYGMTEVSVPFAQRGDVVLLGDPNGFALGIVHLDGMNAAAVATEGLHRVSLSNAVRAWRV